MRRMADLEDEVIEANARFYRAFEALDVAAMDEAWAHGEHVKCVHPGWPLLTGWEAVRESWARIFENTEEMRFTISDVDVVLSGDAGWVTCTENILSEGHGRLSDKQILAHNILQRAVNGRLKIHHLAAQL